MTDHIPQAYLDEAVRRLNGDHGSRCYNATDYSAKILARTLQELGWKPPVDPVEQRAKVIAARVHLCPVDLINSSSTAYKAALIALREGMGDNG